MDFTSCASGSMCIRQGWAGWMLSREPEPKRMPHGGMILRMLCEVTKTALRLTGDVSLTQLHGWVLMLAMRGYSAKLSTTEIKWIFVYVSWSEIKLYCSAQLSAFSPEVFLLLFPCCGVLVGVGGTQCKSPSEHKISHLMSRADVVSGGLLM